MRNMETLKTPSKFEDLVLPQRESNKIASVRPRAIKTPKRRQEVTFPTLTRGLCWEDVLVFLYLPLEGSKII
jgi:hypothetical protein